MAMRVVSPVHVLLTSGTVVRFNNVGILDVLEEENIKSLSDLQIEDLKHMAHLMLSLCVRSMVTEKNSDQALILLQQHYSEDLHTLITTLLSGKTAIKVCEMISERTLDEYDSALIATDALHSHLRNEYENGRMLRLLMKMGFMNERPEYARSPQWSGEIGWLNYLIMLQLSFSLQLIYYPVFFPIPFLSHSFRYFCLLFIFLLPRFFLYRDRG